MSLVQGQKECKNGFPCTLWAVQGIVIKCTAVMGGFFFVKDENQCKVSWAVDGSKICDTGLVISGTSLDF